jgi:tetratricopeptide (TPR) repeat protein
VQGCVWREQPNHSGDRKRLGRSISTIWKVLGGGEAANHALLTHEITVGTQSPPFATTLNNIGSLYLAERRYDQAEPVLGKALRVIEKFQAGTELEMANILNNLPVIKQQTGRRLEADELSARSIGILERTVAADHPKLAVH